MVAQSSNEDVTYGKLSIEQYAFVLAHSLHFPKDDLPEVLERLGVAPEDWVVAIRAWPALMANEVRAEQDTYIKRFGAKFGATRTKLRAERPILASLAPEHVAPAMPDEVAVAVEEEVVPAPKEAALENEGAALRLSESEMTLPLAPPNPAKPLHDVSSPWTNRGSDVPLPPLVPAPPAAHALAGTSLALEIPRGLVMPFKKDAAPPAIAKNPAPPVATKPQKAPNELGGTSMAVNIPRGPALPFAKSRTAAAAPPPALANAPPSPEPAHPKAVALPNSAPTRSQEPPPMPLERHASLCVELSMAPDRMGETLARYRVTAESKAQADSYWRAKMDEEPETRKAWEQAYGVYRTWLMQTMGQQR